MAVSESSNPAFPEPEPEPVPTPSVTRSSFESAVETVMPARHEVVGAKAAVPSADATSADAKAASAKTNTKTVASGGKAKGNTKSKSAGTKPKAINTETSSSAAAKVTPTRKKAASASGATLASDETRPTPRRTTATKKVNGSSSAVKKPARISRRDTWWLLELVSICIGLGCTAALVIILAVYQGRPLSQWPILISINSLLAILTAIIKPAVLFPVARCFMELKWIFSHTERTERDLLGFDAAARGPSGAVKLFFKRFGLLAILGAVITILAVAMDPFLQEMLKYHDCPITLDNRASVAHSNNFTQDVSSASIPGSNRRALQPSIRASQFLAYLDPPANSTQLVRTVCDSGNCTFPLTNGIAYSSLAVCYHLDDLTALVRPPISMGGNVDSGTNYSLPSGIWIQNQKGAPLMATNNYNEQYAQNATENAFFSYEVLQFNNMVCDETLACNYGILAYGVTLYPCVNTYNNASISRGLLYESVVNTTPLIPASDGTGTYYSLAGDFPSASSVDCTPVNQPNGTKVVPAYPNSNNQFQLAVGSQGAPNTGVQYFDPGCAYYVDSVTSATLADSVSEIFGPNNSLINDGNGPYGPEGSTLLVQLFDYGYLSLQGTNEVSANSYAQAMSWTLAATVRAGDFSWYDSTMGSQLISDTCVNVLWPWITLPAVVIALTLIFLIGTIIVATRKGYGRAKPHPSGRRQWNALKNSIWQGAEKAGTAALDGDDARDGHGGKVSTRVTEEILDYLT